MLVLRLGLVPALALARALALVRVLVLALLLVMVPWLALALALGPGGTDVFYALCPLVRAAVPITLAGPAWRVLRAT